mmetsp:Transcript_98425/g.306208  ORF Transcript_98425/g.306208 Transcript_98425/m.306208 type:complete len:235 (+) Transcript_98425:149-853(+)
MKQFKAPAGAANSEPPAKVRAVAQPARQEMEKVVLTFSKLCMSLDLNARQCKAIVINSFKVPKDHPLLVSVIAATGSAHTMAEQLRAQGKSSDEIREAHGPPHLYAFNACLEYLIDQCKGEQMRAEEHFLQQFVKEWDGQPWKVMAAAVRHVARSKMYDKEYMRLEFTILDIEPPPRAPGEAFTTRPYQVWLLFERLLEKDATVRWLAGVAPRGDLAREVQRFIDSATQQPVKK